MKTTLTISTNVPKERVHGATLYKNGVKYAELSRDQALSPWTDAEETKVGDKYLAVLHETPKEVPLDPKEHPGVFVREATHGPHSEPFVVNAQSLAEGHTAHLTGSVA